MSISPRGEPNPDIRRGRNVIHALHAHLVLVPKYRRGVFTDEILTRCEEIMGEVRAKTNAESREFNGHIQRYLRGEHFWSPSCFAASAGGAPLAVVKEYIENQKRPD